MERYLPRDASPVVVAKSTTVSYLVTVAGPHGFSTRFPFHRRRGRRLNRLLQAWYVLVQLNVKLNGTNCAKSSFIWN